MGENESGTHEFGDVLPTLSEEPKNKFLKNVEASLPENEIKESFVAFVDTLQKEADEKFSGPDRDLWFCFHLTQTFMEAKMWDRALEALTDALLVAENMGKGKETFDALKKEIEDNTSTSSTK